jgi:MinD-like ATPase involved in chromosome partitioning or flagellar assembly
VLVSGSRAGVGATTIALALVRCLASRASGRVLLVDASPSMSAALDMDDEPEVPVVAVPWRLGGPGVPEIGPGHDWWAAECASRDVIVVDAGPAALQRRRAFGPVDLHVIVDDGTVPGIVATRRLLQGFAREGMRADRRVVVANRLHPSFFGRLTSRDAAAEIGETPLCSLAYDRGVPALGLRSSSRWTSYLEERALQPLVAHIAALPKTSPALPAPIGSGVTSYPELLTA